VPAAEGIAAACELIARRGTGIGLRSRSGERAARVRVPPEHVVRCPSVFLSPARTPPAAFIPARCLPPPRDFSTRMCSATEGRIALRLDLVSP
jgi:hypothetical protein